MKKSNPKKDKEKILNEKKAEESANKIKESQQKLRMDIQRLLLLLNIPETKSTFWLVNEPNVHMMGIRPVIRTTVEIINENGFTPYENKIKENLFKVFKIYVTKEDDEINIQHKEIKKEIEQNGIIYIKHFDLIYIYETIKESK